MSVCLHVDPSAQIKIQSNKEYNKIALVEALPLPSIFMVDFGQIFGPRF